MTELHAIAASLSAGDFSVKPALRALVLKAKEAVLEEASRLWALVATS